MLNSEGTLYVNEKEKKISINVDADLARLYRWFVIKKLWMVPDVPKHGYHITLTNEKLNHNVNWKLAKKYNGCKVKFQYKEQINIGITFRNFTNFYLTVVSEEIDKFKKLVGIVEKENYQGVHLTLGSIGKMGQPIRYYWPEMIEL